MKKNKFQEPNSKFQINSNIQTKNFGHWNLDFIWDLGFGSWKLLALWCLIFGFLAGCASVEKRPMKKYVPKAKIEREGEVRKEVIRTEPKPFVTSGAPRARASAKMVDEGRTLLSNGQIETAERKFQDAIGIDPDNGIAYYYLAKSKYERGDNEQALGVLDKAEGLLTGSKEWTEAIKELREMIKTELR